MAGALVQAVTIACRVIDACDSEERARSFVHAIKELQGTTDAALLTRLFAHSAQKREEFAALLQTTAERIGGAQDLFPKVPILSSLSSDQLVRLVYTLRTQEVGPGEQIIKEGEPGDAFYWIGRGRVVVSAQNFEGRRVYLTSLADGDCFGEQGFFSGGPRNATVEATEPVLLVQVGKAALESLVEEMPELSESLREFYKERIAESLLARSPLLGKLSVRERRQMAERFSFTNYAAGSLVIKEGEESDSFYAIKDGRVEVFTENDEGETIRLAQLQTGEIFGEIAALKGSTRNASVRALSDCELLRLDAADLKQFLNQNKDVKTKLEALMEERIKDTTTRKILLPK